MPPSIATLAYALVILMLFLLERDRKSKVSSALWIPVTWIVLAGSRSVTQWFGGQGTAESLGSAIEGNPLDAVIYGGLLVAGLTVLVVRKWRFGAFLQWNPLLLIFFFYCALSTLWSDLPLFAFKHWVKAVGDLVMVLVVLTDPDPTAALRRFFARPAFLLFPVSILLIKYYPHLGISFDMWTGQPSPVGITTTKNLLGMICLVFGLGSLWCIVEVVRSGNRGHTARPLIAYGVALMMALWLFSKSHAATAFGCFLIGGGLIIVTSHRALARKPALVHLLIAAVLFIPLYGLILNPAAGLTEMAGRDQTLSGRNQIWDVSLSLAVNPWFGSGYESFWVGERQQKATIAIGGVLVPNAHNGYIEVYLNLGYVGVVLLGLVMASAYRKAIVALCQDPAIGRLKLAFFVVAVIQNLTEHALRELCVVWILFLLAIITIPRRPVSGRLSGSGFTSADQSR